MQQPRGLCIHQHRPGAPNGLYTVRVNREEKKKGEGDFGMQYAALLKAQKKN